MILFLLGKANRRGGEPQGAGETTVPPALSVRSIRAETDFG